MSSQQPSYRPDIDGLRAIAVLLVVFHHAFPSILPGGFIGVDVFFVISGFLISSIIFQNLESGSFSLLDFYVRRIKRIFPALALVLIACLVYGWFSLLPADYKQLGKHTLAGAGFVSNFAFWFESGYFDGDSKLKPLLHLWSLGVEEQYYIFWPLIASVAWKRKNWLFPICIVLLLASLAVNLYTVRHNTVAAFFSPAARFWELLIGSVLAYVTLHPTSTRSINLLDKKHDLFAWIGLCLLIFGVVFINPERRFPGFWALPPTLATYCIIAAGQQAWFNRVILSNRLLVWVGLISFPLYLWHWPLLVLGKQRFAQESSPPMLLLIIAISIVLAWLTYRLVERPSRFGQMFGSRKAVVLAVLMAVIAYLGFNIYKREGLTFRIPTSLQKIATFSNDYAVDSNFGCLIPNSDKDLEIPRHCFENKTVKPKKSILIWGDSYAWGMYAGIYKTANNDADIYMLAKTGCPPLFEGERTKVNFCKPHNARVKDVIKSGKYDQVVLIARWDHWTYQSETYLANLAKTMDQLKVMGVKQIYVVGPSPEWQPGLQDVLVKNALQDVPKHRLQNRLSEGVKTSTFLDQQLKQLATEKGISYISLLNILCNENGCMTKVGNEPEDLIGYDDGHLSRKGGAFVAQHFPTDFFKTP